MEEDIVVLPVADSRDVKGGVSKALYNKAVGKVEFDYYNEIYPEWRKKVRRWVVNPNFEIVMLLLIIADCAVLAAEDTSATGMNATGIIDLIFTTLFSLEVIFKCIASGLWTMPYGTNEGGYFRSNWNRLDFFVTTLCMVTIFLGSSYGGLRAFRLLRILRAASFSMSIRLLVNSLLASLPKLSHVFLLFSVFLMIFAVVAVQLWGGALRNRCVRTLNDWEIDIDPLINDTVCHRRSSSLSGYTCPFGYECVPVANPGYGYLSFDNIFYSLLTLFVAVTLEGWSDLMYHTVNASSNLACIFFVFLVSFGSLFIVNLTLVIITYAFESQYEKEVIRQEELKREAKNKPKVDRIVPAGYTKTWSAKIDQIRNAGTGLSLGSGTGCEALIQDKWVECTTGRLLDEELEDTLIEVYDNGVRVILPVQLVIPIAKTKIAKFCRGLIRTKAFQYSIIALILLNTIALIVDHHGQPPEMTDFLTIANIVFTVAFTLEMIIKIVGLSLMTYLHDSLNTFDCVVVIIGLIELCVSSDSESGTYSILRSLRILRVCRLASRFALLGRWVIIIIRSLRASLVLLFVLMLLLFSYSLIGMQTMGGKFDNLTPPGEPPPRSNFDNIGSSMLTMFQVLTGEDWNTVMYNGMYSTSPLVSAFFTSFFFVGNYLMLNLFVAILLHQSSETGAAKDSETDPSEEGDEMGAIDTGNTAVDNQPVINTKEDDKAVPLLQNFDVDERTAESESETNAVRKKLKWIVEHSVFEFTVLLVIAASTVTLAMEEPLLAPDEPLSRILEIFDFVFVTIFTVECVLKIAAYGLILSKTSYLRRDGWTALDFCIVVTSLLSFAFGRQLGIFRVFRTLRPLRFLNKSKGMKVVVSSLLRSIPAMVNVLVITMLLWGVCGIMGVQLFKGKFYSCTDQSYGDVAGDFYVVNSTSFPLSHRENCLDAPDGDYQWRTWPSHFNHVGAACLTLFEVASLEGWVTVMHLGVDAVSYEISPQLHNRPFMSLYFVIFIIIGSFFVINLFISVLLDTYYTEEEKTEGERVLLTDTQKKWVQSYRVMLRGVDRPPEFFYASPHSGVFVSTCRRIVKWKYFEVCIHIIIVINFAIIATEHYDQSEVWDAIQAFTNIFFVSLFALEAFVKIMACGPAGYFAQSWNRFDFAVLLLCIVSLIITEVGQNGPGTIFSLFRVLRLARVFRLIKGAKSINMLLKTLFLALPTMFNVSSILLLIFVVYAAVGVRLFGRASRGEAITRNANFEEFGTSIMTLVRVATGEGWQQLLADYRRDPPECDPHLDGCVSQPLAIIFFVSFMLSGMYILLNLFIAVILDSFDEVVKEAREEGVICKADMRHFKKSWKKYDPELVYTIPAPIIPTLLLDIGPPLGLEPTATYHTAVLITSNLDLYVCVTCLV
eukprot:TRINITY_DN8729_c1_g1_i1.p1 TRINITY_DN8729_c1_g1~~TRINITY_DN8729_c1_g1_i1.p1  ORF type:complete len:1398 (+),score=173.25 TRINITY_DN8729_c1_g1_i1:148-4341(+)